MEETGLPPGFLRLPFYDLTRKKSRISLIRRADRAPYVTGLPMPVDGGYMAQ